MLSLETAIEVALVWIGICSAACIMALGVLWIGVKMFGDMTGASYGSNDVQSLKKGLEDLEARINVLEMKVNCMNKEED